MSQRVADRPTLVRTAVAAVTAWRLTPAFHARRASAGPLLLFVQLHSERASIERQQAAGFVEKQQPVSEAQLL
jgi:hypothetical protein